MFNLEKNYAGAIIDHAIAEAPNECCGLLAGLEGRVIKLYRCKNAEHSPYLYSVDPHDLIAVYKELQQNGWDLLGIYHSHTHTEAYPSPKDVKSAVLQEALYLIVSLSNPDHPTIRAFNIIEGGVREVELKLTA